MNLDCMTKGIEIGDISLVLYPHHASWKILGLESTVQHLEC